MVLLFQLTWALNVWAWSEHEIDYITLFQLHNIKPNTLQIMDETSSSFLLYTINLVVYYLANSSGSTLHYPVLQYGCPLFLILSTALFLVYQSYSHGKDHISRGLFGKKVVYRCLIAPFAPVTFRDTFAADVLTSFTACISNSCYALCWILSGSFWNTADDDSEFNTRNFGSSYMQCTGPTMLMIIDSFVLVPLWIRFAQCLRSYYDTQLFYPHIYNAIKYFLAILVVVYAMIGGTSDTVYYIFGALAAAYKAFWYVIF
jgi:hypothetical protein